MIGQSGEERKLQWCRDHIPHFAEMEQRKLAAELYAKQVREALTHE